MTKKRPNECFMCSSRNCYEHVYSCEDNGASFNEIACRVHWLDLHYHSDMVAKGVMKCYSSSTGKQDRREL